MLRSKRKKREHFQHAGATSALQDAILPLLGAGLRVGLTIDPMKCGGATKQGHRLVDEFIPIAAAYLITYWVPSTHCISSKNSAHVKYTIHAYMILTKQ